jgi:hypothetical protein
MMKDADLGAMLETLSSEQLEEWRASNRRLANLIINLVLPAAKKRVEPRR